MLSNQIKKNYRLIPLMLFAFTGCSATKIQDSWQHESFSKRYLDNVLVVGLAASYSNRLLFENKFSDIFSNRGIRSIPSHAVLGDNTPSREEVEAYVKSHEVDYVLVTKFGGLELDQEYVPPRSVNYYTGPYYPHYRDYWSSNIITLTREETTITQYNVTLVTSIYNAKSEDLVWVARSESFDVSSVTTVAQQLAKEIDKELYR